MQLSLTGPQSHFPCFMCWLAMWGSRPPCWTEQTQNISLKIGSTRQCCSEVGNPGYPDCWSCIQAWGPPGARKQRVLMEKLMNETKSGKDSLHLKNDSDVLHSEGGTHFYGPVNNQNTSSWNVGYLGLGI